VDDGPSTLRRQFRWGPFGTVIGHLSLVVILAGALVGSAFGFRDTGFVVAEGSTVPVTSGDGLSVELVQFQDAYYTTTGAPADYASDLVIYRGGAEVARQTVRVNEPLRYGDLSFYQSFYGPAAAIRVADKAGAEVFADGVPLAWTEGDSGRRVGSFVIPGADLTVWIIGTAGPATRSSLRARCGGGLQGQRWDRRSAARRSTSAHRSSWPAAPSPSTGMQYTGLSVARDPGPAHLAWIGADDRQASCSCYVPAPAHLGSLVVRTDGRGMLSLAAAGRRDVNSNTEFTDLVTEIRAAFTAPTGR
jgi:cytochrome c biogenesis protein